MPTKASEEYSETGERTGFIDNAVNDAQIDNYLLLGLEKEIEDYMNFL